MINKQATKEEINITFNLIIGMIIVMFILNRLGLL